MEYKGLMHFLLFRWSGTNIFLKGCSFWRIKSFCIKSFILLSLVFPKGRKLSSQNFVDIIFFGKLVG